MKNKFRGYFPYTEDETNQIWDSADFVFDANVLLDLFRVSNNTREIYFTILKKLDNRIWLPYNVCEEFVSNKERIKNEYNSLFENIKKDLYIKSHENKINQLNNSIVGNSKDFDSLKSYIKRVNNKIEKDLSMIKENHFNGFDFDNIQDRVITTLNDRIGEKMSDEEISMIIKEGASRYKNKIPPGYMDAKKDNEKKYGDLINWFDIIKYSEENDKDIIFVTRDEKEDWFKNEKGKMPKARAELATEFNNKTSNKIIIYRVNDFIRQSASRFNIKINLDEAVSELMTMNNNNLLYDLRLPASYYEDEMDEYTRNQFSLNNIIVKDNTLGLKELKSLKTEKRLLELKISFQEFKIKGLRTSEEYNLEDNTMEETELYFEIKKLKESLHNKEIEIQILKHKLGM